MISVILPVFNSEVVIEKAIKSVINQKYSDFELIIINDGSKDNTKSICEKYLKDNRIKLINISNAGVSNARNVGIKNANGKYITFLDSDDTYTKDFLEKMLISIESSESDLCICGYVGVNENTQKEKNIKNVSKCFLKQEFDKLVEITQKNNLFNQVWNKIFRTDIIKNNDIGFDTKFSFGEDYKFVLEYICYTEKIINIEDCLYYYTNSTNGLNSKKVKNRYESNLQNFFLMEKIFDDNNFNKTYLDSKFVRMYLSEIEHIHIIAKDKNEKIEMLNSLINDERSNNRVKTLKKYFLFRKIILNKKVKLISALATLLEIYDKIEKKIKLGY